MADNRNKVINFLFNRKKAFGAFFVVFYLVGLAGTLVPHTFLLFLKLIPFALLLSFVALFIFHEDGITLKTAICFLLIYLVSFFTEAIGVRTGLIFGQYAYGSSLGIKLFETPLIIGINWFFLVYTTAALIDRFLMPSWIKVLMASTLMLVYDVVLEQLAPILDMWHWKNEIVPMQNYLVWFALALVFQTVLKFMNVKIQNKLALLILICQFLYLLIVLLSIKILVWF
jgi:bisanhydrobacterioruberin hydratase